MKITFWDFLFKWRSDFGFFSREEVFFKEFKDLPVSEATKLYLKARKGVLFLPKTAQRPLPKQGIIVVNTLVDVAEWTEKHFLTVAKKQNRERKFVFLSRKTCSIPFVNNYEVLRVKKNYKTFSGLKKFIKSALRRER